MEEMNKKKKDPPPHEALTLEQRLVATLMRGVTSQVTVMIRKYLQDMHYGTDGNPCDILYMLVPLWIVLYMFKTPQMTIGLIQSIILDTVFNQVDVEDDVLSIVNLLGVYFLYSSSYPNPKDDFGNIIGTAQYLVVFRIAQNVGQSHQGDSLMGLVFLLLLYPLYYWVDGFKRIQDLVALLGVHMAQNWFVGVIPVDSRLASLLLVIYAVFPFIKYIHIAADMYNFVVMNLTNSLSVKDIPYWVQVCIALQAWVLSWNIQQDEVSLTVTKFTLIRLMQLAFMDALAKTVSVQDQFLVYTLMIMALQFITEWIT